MVERFALHSGSSQSQFDSQTPRVEASPHDLQTVHPEQLNDPMKCRGRQESGKGPRNPNRGMGVHPDLQLRL